MVIQKGGLVYCTYLAVAFSLMFIAYIFVTTGNTTARRITRVDYVAYITARTFDPITSIPDDLKPTALINLCDAQLGNQMSSYATLLALEKEYGVKMFIRPQIVEFLGKYFTDEKFPRIDIEYPDWEGKNWIMTYPDINNPDHTTWPPNKFGQFIRIYGDDSVGNFINDVSLFKRHLDEIKKAFVLNNKFVIEAQKRLSEVKKLSAYQNDSETTFISIHNRRTDYGPVLEAMGGHKFLSSDYFSRAIHLCREKYKNPIFLIISDDMDWAIANLENVDEGIFYVGSQKPFPAGQEIFSQDDQRGIDLALMRLANHSIITYGTFGMWGALLAGGDCLMPLSDFYVNQQIILANLTGWVAI